MSLEAGLLFGELVWIGSDKLETAKFLMGCWVPGTVLGCDVGSDPSLTPDPEKAVKFGGKLEILTGDLSNMLVILGVPVGAGGSLGSFFLGG